MSTIAGPAEHLEAIGVAAGRIRRYGEAISQAHHFGIAEGTHRDLTTSDYQRDAVPVYNETLPWPYLVDLAAKFSEIAHMMSTIAPPPTAEREWLAIYDYLRSAVSAITDAAPIPATALRPDDEPEIEPVTPPVMRFGRLAELVHEEGAVNLVQAAKMVESLCGTDDTCPLNDQEKNWLRRFISGDRVVDVAIDDGYSERSMYRALGELWGRLGVSGRTSAIALALDNGWLE